MLKKIDLKLVFSIVILSLVVISAVFSSLIAPVDPLEQDLLYEKTAPYWMLDDTETESSSNEYVEENALFLLGSDSLGRDVFSRIIYGSRIALMVALIAAPIACLIGTILGLLAGFYGTWVDAVISRLIDIWMSFPAVLLSVLLVAVLGSGIHSVIIAIIVIDWTRFARVVRAETASQRTLEYVDSAVCLGDKSWRIIVFEILINVFPTIIVLLTLEMGIAIVVEAILSFVGLSVSSDTPTWGGMIASGREIIHQAPWVMFFPLATLICTVLALNLLGDCLRKRIDPVLKR